MFDGGNPSEGGLEFTITNGQVTGITWVDGTRSFPLHLPSDATFTVGTSSITETVTRTSSTEIIQYVPETTTSSSGATLYQMASDTTTFTTPTTTSNNGNTFGYSFTETNGVVTGMQETFGNGTHTHTVNLPLSPAATFTISGSTVTANFVEGNTVDTFTYVEPSGSTLYAIASEATTYILPGTATTLLSVNPFDRDEFTIGSGGTVTQVQSVSLTGALSTITPNSHMSFSQLATGFVQETLTYGSHTSYVVYYEGGTNGIYTEVAHGSGTTVSLTGLQAQLAQLPAALGALV